jgi:hypothetical protein
MGILASGDIKQVFSGLSLKRKIISIIIPLLLAIFLLGYIAFHV